MSSHWRLWFRGIVLVIVLVLAGDWGLSTVRSAQVHIDLSLNPPRVLADGKHKTVLTIHITENGQPRVHDLLQIWLASGGGVLLPQWVYSDRTGKARVVYQPNPASPYDLQSDTTLTVEDTSLGHLVEVTKQGHAHIVLITPKQ
jgi:hypothetical protein